jgi:hypothetical protein
VQVGQFRAAQEATARLRHQDASARYFAAADAGQRTADPEILGFGTDDPDPSSDELKLHCRAA